MARELFEPLDKENPGGEEEDTVILKGTFQSVLDHGWTWKDMLGLLSDKIVFTSTECAVLLSGSDAPEEHDYQLDILVSRENCSDEILQVSSTGPETAASTVNGLLLMFSKSDVNLSLTFKCFATQPRKAFPSLLSDSDFVGNCLVGSKVQCVRFHFVALDQITCQLMAMSVVEIELRQCTVAGLDQALGSNPALRKLTISCTMPEFAKFAPGLAGNQNLKELDLLLHFWLQGDPFAAFTSALEGNKGLEKLTVSYLDINDDGWIALFKSIAAHECLQVLNLKFTDNFVDSYRRLRNERRTTRTQAVLEFVQQNTNIQAVTWPDYQQDEELMDEIKACLVRNKSAQAS